MSEREESRIARVAPHFLALGLLLLLAVTALFSIRAARNAGSSRNRRSEQMDPRGPSHGGSFQKTGDSDGTRQDDPKADPNEFVSELRVKVIVSAVASKPATGGRVKTGQAFGP